MTTTRRRPRALGATALAVGLVLVAGACSADGEPWPVLSYTVDDAGTSLTLHAEVTDGVTVRAAVVSEDDDAVKVDLQAVPSDGNYLAVMVNRSDTIELDAPLGDRAVVDAHTNRPVPEGDPDQAPR